MVIYHFSPAKEKDPADGLSKVNEYPGGRGR
jgi:hypothetical protein